MIKSLRSLEKILTKTPMNSLVARLHDFSDWHSSLPLATKVGLGCAAVATTIVAIKGATYLYRNNNGLVANMHATPNDTNNKIANHSRLTSIKNIIFDPLFYGSCFTFASLSLLKLKLKSNNLNKV